VPPLALIRCSRGGKTRALKEMAKALKHRLGPQASVIYISLNDYSSLGESEQNNAVRALCRRIAFEARNTKVEGNLHDAYKNFSMDASELEILAIIPVYCL